MTSRLTLKHVSKTFRENGATVPAVSDISFTATPGEFITIIGPSGSGKSTLFNLITGLLVPDEGTIELDNEPINGRTGLVGYMPQRDLLLAWRTVLDNVLLAPEIAGKPRDQAVEHARTLMPVFGLEGFENVFPATLSGGMRQRAALLRTFLMERNVMLLDEPFGALDALTRRDLQNWLLGVWAQFSPTILFVTHDVREAVLLGDRVIVLSSRPGRIKQEIAINLSRPRLDSDEAFIKMQVEVLKALE
jgi:ABC-type nitrate/sulfonate/bicarbonate transport system ATPase subunit